MPDIKGYREITAAERELVNANKENEEQMLQAFDILQAQPEIDKRWLGIARTHFEQGFMALNRAIMRPQRFALPGDADGKAG